MDSLQPITATLGFLAGSYWLARLTKPRSGVPTSEARQLSTLADFQPLQLLSGSFGGDYLALLGTFPWLKEGQKAIVIVKSANRVPASADDVLKLGLELQVESGAEYSYFKGRGAFMSWACNIEVICPASAKQIRRHTQAPMHNSLESASFYYERVLGWLEETGSMGPALDWVHAVLEGRKEANRCLVNDEEFLVNVDTKWNNHPNADAVPRSEWAEKINPGQLYCLGIAKLDIPDLRHLRGEHVAMLERMRVEGLAAIHDIYGISPDSIRCFIHYPPQFYRLHVHFTHVHNAVSHTSSVPKAWSLQTVIECLKTDPLFFSKATMEVMYREGEARPIENSAAN